ncbi:MAG TPA: hypothetical protein VK821_05990 [Dehalococcoidia bacterium]|nr:hypothetical protein [Dehalococcoidia bacterium]
MSSLTVPLYGLFVDHNGNPYEYARTRVVIINSSGRLSVDNQECTPFSRHVFTVSDGEAFGFGGSLQLSPDQVVQLYASCCSLANRRILFTSRIFQEEKSRVSYSPEPGILIGRSVDGQGRPVTTFARQVRETVLLSRLTKDDVELDEGNIYKIAGCISSKVLSHQNGNVWAANMNDAMQAYSEARNAFDPEPRYMQLHVALEKAAFAGGGDDSNFVSEVSALTKLIDTRVKELHVFNNRAKHIIRAGKYGQDRAVLEQARASMASWLLDMKQAVDRVITDRL